MTRVVSVFTMLTQIHGLTEGDVNGWEKEFIDSVWERSAEGRDTSRLSTKQCEHIEKIWKKHFA